MCEIHRASMRCSHPSWLIRRLLRIFLYVIFGILLVTILVTIFHDLISKLEHNDRVVSKLFVRESSRNRQSLYYFIPLFQAPEHHINISISNNLVSKPLYSNPSVSHVPGTKKCGFHSCFNIYRCGRLEPDRLSIYIYPIRRIFINGKPLQTTISKEFYELIETIVQSPYYVSDPNEACLFVPMIDLLNLNPFIEPGSSTSMLDVLHALRSLEFWGEHGENHLLFSMYPNSDPLISLSSAAILISSSFSSITYRLGFHVPFIMFNPVAVLNNLESLETVNITRKIFCISVRSFQSEDLLTEDLLVLDRCKNNPSDYSVRCSNSAVYSYPQILTAAEFCLVQDLSDTLLWDAMSAGCIPVIAAGQYRLPFDEVIDWSRNSIMLYDHQLQEIGTILRSISNARKQKLKAQVKFTFKKYFETVPHLVSTVLELLKGRIFPHSARTIHEWNFNTNHSHKTSPIFNPVTVSRSSGFTAVILAYERIHSLFQVMERIARIPSLSKILIIWNNQKLRPPSEKNWPLIPKPYKIIDTTANKLSNRFYPYDEILTEAVFSVDDDITMLTTDEIDFGFHVWQEFPDRLVGFPSRSHVFDNTTLHWKYESEWTSEISMVLTGAAFYHKYWHYAFFNEMPQEILRSVDTKMNCEDIAMNFLIADRTGKPPIKVTPRKKFKCPTCLTNEMLSSETNHMRERTECINRFADIYGYMPLQPVEFRADPVLFKVDALPKKMKKFHDIGSL